MEQQKVPTVETNLDFMASQCAFILETGFDYDGIAMHCNGIMGQWRIVYMVKDW